VFAYSVHVETDFVRELDLLEQPLHPFVRADRSPTLRIGRRLTEAVDPKLHAF